jgi:hypothetical protein
MSASKNPDGSCSGRSRRDPFLNIRREILAEKYMFKCRKIANGAIINKETDPTWHENATKSYVSRTSRFFKDTGIFKIHRKAQSQ